MKRGARPRVLVILAVVIATTLVVMGATSSSSSGAAAPLALDAKVRKHQAGAATAIVSPAFSTHHANEVVLAFVDSDGPGRRGGQSFSSVRGGGLTWVLRRRSNTQAGTAEIWQATARKLLSRATVTATRAHGSYPGSILVVSFSGAETRVRGAVARASAATGAPHVSLRTTRKNSWVWATGNDWDRAIARRLGSRQSMSDQYVAARTGDTYWTQHTTGRTPKARTKVTLNDTSPKRDRWNFAAIEILAANPGAAPPTPRPPAPRPPTHKVIFSDHFVGTHLNPAWAVVSRHGEYAQNETECNTAHEVTVANRLTISTIAKPTRCGDFNVDGSVRTHSTVWPYATGDIQWKTFNFTYGTVNYRAKFPPRSTSTWPAIWMLGSNCQQTNRFTADTGYHTCPGIGSAHYTEIDLTECYGPHWCQLALAQEGSFPLCNYRTPTDTNWHTYRFVWAPGSISISVDGRSTGCHYTSAEGYTIPSTPMFLIIQTQTGGIGGTPANLPTTLQVSAVSVTKP